MKSSVFSRRMQYLNKRYLLILRSANEGFKGRTQLNSYFLAVFEDFVLLPRAEY